MCEILSINLITFVGESQHPSHSSEAKEDVEMQSEGEYNYNSGLDIELDLLRACVTNTRTVKQRSRLEGNYITRNHRCSVLLLVQSLMR